jgi:Secretion system C-terminal sorting domain
MVSKKLKDDAGYLQQIQLCAGGAQSISLKATVYPNPGRGTYKCMLNNEPIIPEEINIFNSNGALSAHFFNSWQFNISQLPAGVYFYQLHIKGATYRGKLIKQ